ncbi:MAG: hypothetical protein MI922_13350 [Bacteroidales bacterium]|nr:hypothetical protein [Bacteroidales bacterium]
MKSFLINLKWQFILLQKNKIVSISLVVTLIYGLLLYFLRDVGNLDKVLVAMVLNDPSVIGFFFIALAVYTEIRHQVLTAIFVSPANIHQILITKTLSLSIIGVVCALGLAISVKGIHFDMVSYMFGALGICLLSTLLGLIVLTFASEFLKFVMLSIPIFLFFINIPLFQYLGAIDLGFAAYFFPIQGSVDLIDTSFSEKEINIWYSYLSWIVMVPIFYLIAFNLFSKKITHK